MTDDPKEYDVRRAERLARRETQKARDVLRDEWAARNGLTSAGGRLCWHRLLTGRCPTVKRGYGRIYDCAQPPGYDHPSLWSKPGEAGVAHVLVYQPYSLSTQTITDLAAFVHTNGLDVQITSWPAWHNPGAVLHVELRRARAD